jgi:hypothetical protein
MVQKLIPKEEKKSSSFVNFALIISILVLIGSGAGYFWVKAQVGETEEEIYRVETETLNTRESGDKEVEKQVSSYAKKISDFSTLLGLREEIFPFFGFLEELMHKRVSLTKMSMDIKTGVLSLEGEAENFRVLAEQMLILKDNDSIIEPVLNNLSLGEEGGVEFGITLSLDSGIFDNE